MTYLALNGACLHAHIRLRLGPRDAQEWRCTDCGQPFAPVEAQSDAKAEAELERLRKIARAAGREC